MYSSARPSSGHPQIASVGDVLDDDPRYHDPVTLRPLPTGFTPLDRYLGGGLHTGELLLLGGAQGLGKTTWALQLARHVAASGAGRVLYVCYEHDRGYLLERLLAMESALGDDADPLDLAELRRYLSGQSHQPARGLDDLLGRLDRARPACERIRAYQHRLFLVRAGAATTLDTIAHLADSCPGDGPLLVVVDYLQKVAVEPDPGSDERATRQVVEGLKDLALTRSARVVAVVAAELDGITAPRMRIHHLRGGATLAYEADAVLLLNDKYRTVARQHLLYQPQLAEQFRDWVVVSVEKNRGGLHGVDLELRKRFAWGCFDPDGRPVDQQLIDGRLYLA